jgi:leader peptidase (prepilin peptidase) / N-methyltransferase
MLELFPRLLALALGLAFGSFNNVLIYRIPKGASIVSPPSSCPTCHTRLKPWHNIPVLSWLFLRGQCAHCKTPISVQYPLIEGLTALLFMALAEWLPLGLSWLVFMPMLGLLLALVVIDWRHMRLPNPLVIALACFGLLGTGLQALAPLTGLPLEGFPTPLAATAGSILGGGSLWLVAWIGYWIMKRDAMGGGDIKLMFALGLFLGGAKVLLAIFLASFLGAIAGLAMRGASFEERPFGPWLALGSLIALVYGDALIELYLSLVLT